MAAWRNHWFIPVALAIVVADAAVAWHTAWPSAHVELGVVLDLAILLPLLFALRYRNLLRTIAVACFGLWLAGVLVPTQHHVLLDDLRWVRYAAMAVLAVVEIRLVVAMYRIVFRAKSRADADAQLASTGLPPAVVRLVAWEAAFWRRVLRRPPE